MFSQNAIAEGLTTAGNIAGILGYSAFALTLMLPTRLHVLEKWLHGLPHMYFIHHIAGIAAFELILLHPVLLALGHGVSDPQAAAWFLIPRWSLIQLSGWLGLLLMIVAVGTTFIKHIRYETWRIIHSFTGIAFIAGLVHVLLLASGPKQIFYSVIALPALSSFFYWEVYHRIWAKSVGYRVLETKLISPRIVEITLEPMTETFKFSPGQFLYLAIVKPMPGSALEQFKGEPHPFTIASGPSEQLLRLVVKACGDFTEHLLTIEPGTEVSLEGPYGDFFRSKQIGKSEIWVAGGIGIVPFLSRARAGNFHRADLHYFVQSPSNPAFAEELEHLKQGGKLNMFMHFGTQPDGASILREIERHSNELTAHHEIYTCGPKPFMRSLKSAIQKKGLSRKSLHTEEFNWL